MCGIVYAKRKEYGSVKPAIKRYRAQKSRGNDGFGFVAVADNKMIAYERTEYWNDMESIILKYKDNANEVMFHHRMPTSTPNIAEMTHPIMVDNILLKNKYYLIHNGVLTNEDEKKKEHNAKGFVYTTEAVEQQVYMFALGNSVTYEKESCFNDSEALAVEFALWNEGHIDKIGVKGSVAFMCYEVDKETNDIIAVHFGHNDGNPLIMWSDYKKFRGLIMDNEIEKSEEELADIFSNSNLLTITSQSTSDNRTPLEEDYVYSYYHQTKTAKIRKVHVGEYYTKSYSTTTVGQAIGYDTTRGSSYWNGYRYEDELDLDYPPVGDQSKGAIITPYKKVEPIADVKKYHTMTKEDLQWEEVALGDKLDDLYKDRDEWEQMMRQLSAGKDTTINGVFWSIEDVIAEIDNCNAEIKTVEDLTEEVAVLLDSKFPALNFYKKDEVF